MEDDVHLLRALSYFLRQKGMRVEEATDGERGLERYFETRPDVLIIDNSLPGKMGYEVCREIRVHEEGAHTPIIMISAFMKVLGVEAEASAQDDELVDGFLRKPFQLEQLWETISLMNVSGRFVRPGQRGRGATTTGARSAMGAEGLPRKGRCKHLPFVGLMARALTTQATGLLTMREDKRVRRLYFANGFPVFARSNLIRENLLRYLLQHEMIDVETYRKHLSQMQREHWRPGVALVREGVISLSRLNHYQQTLVEGIVARCLDWHEASFEFVETKAPIEQAVVYNINPFQILDRWLHAQIEGRTLLRRLQPVLRLRVGPSDHFESWRHMLDWAFEDDPSFEARVADGVEPGELLQGPASQLRRRARRLQSLLMLRALCFDEGQVPREHTERFLQRLMRLHDESDSGEAAGDAGDAASPAEGEAPQGAAPSGAERRGGSREARLEGPGRPASRADVAASEREPAVEGRQAVGAERAGGASNTQLQRIYEVVLRDYRRIMEPGSPHDVLRVSPSDPIEMIRKRYEQFERFYRPDNFLRLGESQLYQFAIEIRQAMARAMAEIEARLSTGMSPLDQSSSSFGDSRQDWMNAPAADDPLAQIFFNDGLTFLRLSDFDEAQAHFERAAERMPARATFRAYLIWSDFLRANRSREASSIAREALEQLLDRFPEEDTIYHFLAHIHREEGDLERAVLFYRKAADLNPNNRSARLFLQRLGDD